MLRGLFPSTRTQSLTHLSTYSLARPFPPSFLLPLHFLSLTFRVNVFFFFLHCSSRALNNSWDFLTALPSLPPSPERKCICVSCRHRRRGRANDKNIKGLSEKGKKKTKRARDWKIDTQKSGRDKELLPSHQRQHPSP